MIVGTTYFMIVGQLGPFDFKRNK